MPKKIAALLSSLFFLFSPSAFAQSTTYTYDNNGRLKTVEDTDIGIVSYDYDDAGNLTNRAVTPGGTAAPPTCNGPYVTGAGSSTATVEPLDICSDPNGDTMEITSATITSSNGASIQTHNATQIYFENIPCSDTTFADFTITDGNGGSATGEIQVVRLGC